MTRKLMLWLTGATILFWVVASGFGAYVMRDEFDEVFDGALQETAQRLMPLVVDDLFQNEESASPHRVDGNMAGEEEYLTYQVRDSTGAILLHSHDAPSTPFDVPLKRGFFDSDTQRFYTEEAVSGTLFLQVADRLDHRQEAMQEALLTLLLPIFLLAPLSLAAIRYFVTRSLRPIATLRQEIGARDGGNLAPLTVGNLPAELEPITVSVNRLLERLRTALEAERDFAANSAHELRTPIAGALAQTQRLIAELQPGPEKVRAGAIEASLTALAHLAEKLLQLARADSGVAASTLPVDIVPVTKFIVEEFERATRYSGRTRLDLTMLAPNAVVVRRVDIDTLGIILRNLIENAFLHGSQSEPVRIDISADGVIGVTNRGVVVASDQIGQLTKRYVRGTSSAEGSGLGLAIADTLGRQMGADLRFSSPPPDAVDGFRAELVLPA